MTRTFALSAALLSLSLVSPALAQPRAERVEDKGGTTVNGQKAEWNVSYLKLVGLADAAVAKQVNAALQKLALGPKQEFLHNLRDWDSQSEYGSSIDLGMTVGILNEELLSVSISSSEYYAGAAHPGHSLRSATFDLKSGKPLEAASLFRPGAMDEVARRVDRALRQNPDNYPNGQVNADEYTLDTPTAEEIKTVVVHPDGLEVLFGDYELGGYAAGLPSAKLSFADLQGVLAEAGPVARLAQGAASGGQAAGPASPSAGAAGALDALGGGLR